MTYLNTLFAILETVELKLFMACLESLPITSSNLSFREFLGRMNTALQIQQSEHSLNQIEGSSFVASKKKRKTFAKYSNEGNSENNSYILPKTYDDFLNELHNACQQGNDDSKRIVEKLAPHMAKHSMRPLCLIKVKDSNGKCHVFL